MSVESFEPVGRWLVVVGLVIAAIGVTLVLAPRIPILGHLPGDITIERGDVTIFIPLGSMLVVSVVVSLILGLLGRR